MTRCILCIVLALIAFVAAYLGLRALFSTGEHLLVVVWHLALTVLALIGIWFLASRRQRSRIEA